MQALLQIPSRSTRESTLPREFSTSNEDQKDVGTGRRRPGNIGSRLTSKLRELWNLRVPRHLPSTRPPITLTLPTHTPASPGILADTAEIPVPPALTFGNATPAETASPGVQTDTATVPMPPPPVSGNATPTERASPGIQTDATTSPEPLPPACGIADPTEATSTLPPTDASIVACSMVPQNDPRAIEYRQVVLPKLRRMMARYFSNSAGGEPIEVFLKWGDSGKPTVFIICRKPKKMSKAIKNSGCINHQIFDVKIEKGPDLRYTAEQRIRPEHENHPLSIPDLPSCASGFPIRSFHKNKLLGSALVGGVVRIDDKLWGLTVFHFLKEPQKKDGIATESEHEPGISTSGESSEVSSLHSVPSITIDETSPPNPPLSDIDISLQPWVQSETEGKPIQLIRIRWASGTRLSKWPYYQPTDTSTESGDFGIEDIRCIMDWALVDLGDIPFLSNRYVERDDELKIVRSTTNPGDKRVDILVKGEVYCKGYVSGNPCLLGLQDTGGYGLAFMVSTDRELQEGISGAWIVDSKTSELIGHLFAVSASSNRGYFIPINETFKDISATLKADKIQVQMVSDEQSGDIVNSSLPSPHCPHDSGQSTEFPQFEPVSTPVPRQTSLQKAVQGVRSFTVASIQKHQLVHSPDPFTPSGFVSETATDNLTNPIVKSLGARLDHVRKGFLPNHTMLLQLWVKISFEAVAGISTAAVATRMIGNPIGGGALRLGLRGGLLRSLMVDIAPLLACLLWADIIPLFNFKPPRSLHETRWIFWTFIYIYPFVVSLCLGYTYKLMGGYAIAGIPAVISSIIQVESARRLLSKPEEIKHGWRCSSMWAMHNWEYGYVMGEAVTGLFLMFPSGVYPPQFAIPAGTVYGVIVLTKAKACSIIMQLYENRSLARAKHRTDSTSSPNYGPWWRQIIDVVVPGRLLRSANSEDRETEAPAIELQEVRVEQVAT